MKRFLTLALIAFIVLHTLSACGCDDGKDVDLVFLNESNRGIVAVCVETESSSEVAQRADSCPMKRGETFGFEAGEYPVTVLVYDTAVGRIGEGELARITVDEAPAEGERWYVTARDGAGGLVLAVDTLWREGV